MQDDLTRAQHYLELAQQMRTIAELEPDLPRRQELLGLADKYHTLAKRLIACRASD